MLSVAARWGVRMKSYLLAEVKNGKLVQTIIPNEIATYMNMKGKNIFTVPGYFWVYKFQSV